MDFNFISSRRCAKTERTSGKAAGGRVYGWLLLMAVLAGQVSAQSECVDPPPLCELSFSPSANLLLGESFNVTCVINSGCIPDCYNVHFLYNPAERDPLSTENVTFSQFGFITQLPHTDECGLTLSINPEAIDESGNNYLYWVNNAEWSGISVVSGRTQGSANSTKVQSFLERIPQENIEATLIQPLDIVTNIFAPARSQQIKGNLRARVMIQWPHADSLKSVDDTYFGRQYIINGITLTGSEGELSRTPDNSTEITVNSEQVARNFTLITENQLGASENGTTPFQFPWPEPVIHLIRENENKWLMVVDFSEPVTDLTLYDSQSISIALDNLGIFQSITNENLIRSTLTFTANLMNGQDYTWRLNLQNIVNMREDQGTMQRTMQESQATMDDNKSNSGIHSQALPQLLVTAAIAALAVNRLMSVRTP